MRSKAQGVFGSRLAVAITAVIVTTVVIAGGVAAASVANNSVSTAKIQNGAVTTAKLRNGAVTTPKIRNGAVTTAKLAPRARVRAATSTNSNSIPGNGANQIVESATITTPGPGLLLITGSFRPNVSVTDVYGCSLFLNGTIMAASSRQAEVESSAPENSCHMNDGVAVTAGTHTVEIQASGVNPSNSINQRSLQVLFVPNF